MADKVMNIFITKQPFSRWWLRLQQLFTSFSNLLHMIHYGEVSHTENMSDNMNCNFRGGVSNTSLSLMLLTHSNNLRPNKFMLPRGWTVHDFPLAPPSGRWLIHYFPLFYSSGCGSRSQTGRAGSCPLIHVSCPAGPRDSCCHICVFIAFTPQLLLWIENSSPSLPVLLKSSPHPILSSPICTWPCSPTVNIKHV